MQPTTNKIDDKTLDEAAKTLMLCLPEHASELIHELAEDHLCPVWQVVCGVVLEVYMQGMLSNFMIEPAWTEGISQYEYVCETCKQSFKPVNVGQRFCCNECGFASLEATLAKPTKPTITMPVIEEPKDEPVTRHSEPIEPSDPVVASTKPDDADSLTARIARLTKKTPQPSTAGWSDEPLPVD